MPDSSSTAVEAKAPVEFGLAEAIRGYFRDDRSRMTMSAARKFGVPEQKVLEALIGQWPIVRLRDGAFRELMEALPDLGLMRVFVRSRAAVIEAVGTFGGFSETGPFFNVQTDTLDMHILAGEVAAVFGVQKVGHDSTINTYSFQLFDHDGAAAFKVFLWDGYPDVPAHRIEAFHELSRRFAADPDSARDAWLDLGESGGHDSSVEAEGLPPSAEALSVGTSPEIAPQTAAGSAAARPTIVEPDRVQIPLPEGVVPGSSSFGQKILDDSMADEHQVVEPMPRSVVMVKYSIRGTLALVVLSFLCLLAILAAPFFWLHFENYPRLTDAPKTVQTEQSDASDPLNVALLGGEKDLVRALLEAGWSPADPLTFQLANQNYRELMKARPFPRASLINLFLFGRRQDLMFEKPAGKEGRHGLRLWKSVELGTGGRPLWMGSVIFERGSDTISGRHRIAPDLDIERDALLDDLARVLWLSEVCQVTGIGPTFSGRTAAGNTYYTDGELAIGTISPKEPQKLPPERLASTLLVRIKDRVWSELKPLVADSGDE